MAISAYSSSRYVLKSVEEVSSEKNSEDQCGSYGFVYNVKVDGLLRIAKRPHALFLTKVSVSERNQVLTKFENECSLLSHLRHPNIVQFIGIYYWGKSKDNIALVMEKLEYDLAKFVSVVPDIQLVKKLSILRDVTYGLVYLHECNPQIIHRDLTARNILLTRSHQAKIADFGMSKVMDESTEKESAYTLVPGQIFYMPPEAILEKPMYNSKLDVFSFGHLCLHTLLGKYPEVNEVQETPGMRKKGNIQIMRRLVNLDRIGSNHCMYPLIVKCLSDYPDKRPSTREVNTSVCLLVENEFKSEESCSNPKCLAMKRQMHVQQEEIEDKAISIASLEETVTHLKKEICQAEHENEIEKSKVFRKYQDYTDDDESFPNERVPESNQVQQHFRDFDESIDNYQNYSRSFKVPNQGGIDESEDEKVYPSITIRQTSSGETKDNKDKRCKNTFQSVSLAQLSHRRRNPLFPPPSSHGCGMKNEQEESNHLSAFDNFAVDETGQNNQSMSSEKVPKNKEDITKSALWNISRDSGHWSLHGSSDFDVMNMSQQQ